MRKIAISTIIAITALSCQMEDTVNPITQKIQESTITLTEGQVDDLITNNFGNTQLTFEEKNRFLLEYVASLTKAEVGESKPTSSGRTNSIYKVLVTAGVYDGASGIWSFNTKVSQGNVRVSTSNLLLSQASSYTFASSGSIYHDTNNDGAFDLLYAVDTKGPLTINNCGVDDIIAYARTSWNPPPYSPSGYLIELTVGCSD